MRDHALIAICAIMALTALTPTASAQGTSRAQTTPSEETPSEATKAEASAHFRRGADLFQDGLYRAALVELKRAYEIAPNYRVLYNVGQTHMALGEFVEAIQAYEEFLNQGGTEIDAARRSDLRGQLEQLRRNTATVAIQVSQVGATISVFAYIFDCGGRPAANVSLAPSNAPDAKVIPLQGESGLLVGSTKTTSDGTMIVVNLPPNRVQVFTLRDEDTGRVITDTLNFIPRGPAVNLIMYHPRHTSVKQWTAQAQRLGSGPP
jgi:hypothetical protein